MKFVYLILAMAITPFLMEIVNARTSKAGNMQLVLKGVPAYLVNVILCALVTLVICLLPGGWHFSLEDFLILLVAVYFGNNFFFNVAIKPIVAHRKGGE